MVSLPPTRRNGVMVAQRLAKSSVGNGVWVRFPISPLGVSAVPDTRTSAKLGIENFLPKMMKHGDCITPWAAFAKKYKVLMAFGQVA